MKSILYTVACLIIGPLCIWHGFSDIATALMSKTWPTVQGIVESIDVDASRGSRGRMTYTPIVRYSFDVAGTHYLGERLSYSDQSSSSRDDVRDVLSRYSEGQPVTVHYQRKDPNTATLQVGTNASNWFVLAIGLVATGLGLFLGRAHWQNLTSTDFRPASGF